MLALQIGLGIWIGGILIGATVWAGGTVAERIKKNTRFGAPWWRGLLWAS